MSAAKRAEPGVTASGRLAPAIGRSLRHLVPVAIALLLAGCVPIGVRVQNMLALWQG
ncbi:MAG TPA: hypothetical protein VFO53_15410 [Casimicrobiaceae bacterium]|nr:hypothetical protein [Casimicrobiaceae bacterium]